MTKKGTLQGREVELREVMYGVGRAALQLGTAHEQSLEILIHSAHWADTGELVFPSLKVLDTEWPMHAWREINALMVLSNEVNLEERTADPATTNGTGESSHPSLTPEQFLLHRLALALGRTVGELERTMTIREVQTWSRFLIFHPLPSDLIDIHGARQLAMTANANRAADTPAFDWQDFLLIRRERSETTTAPAKPQKTMAQKMMAVANRQYGGT